MKFDYILEKISKAEFQNHPFKHLYIKDFLSDKHLQMLLTDSQVHFQECSSNVELKNMLKKNGYVSISFPGCTTDEEEYFKSLESGNWESISLKNNHYDNLGEEIEGYGVTYQLQRIVNPEVAEIVNFFRSNEFRKIVQEKFNINRPTRGLSAIQKNLTKYEISPHPDIRNKAMTFLININHNQSHSIASKNFNTQIMKFKENKKYIYNFWENNQEIDRGWVPWSWCKTEKVCKHNNSIIMFAPSNDTLHSVRLNYDHLPFQRTQIYGNLMFVDRKSYKIISHKDL